MITETVNFILDSNKIYFANNKTELDGDIKDGLVIYKKYSTEVTKICDIVYDCTESVCKTIFINNSLVDNILTWPDYQEFAALLDEAHYKIEFANKLQEYKDLLD